MIVTSSKAACCFLDTECLPVLLLDWVIYFSNHPILVHVGCCNKILQTGWLIHNRNLLFPVLEAGSPRSGCQRAWVCCNLSQVSDCLISCSAVTG